MGLSIWRVVLIVLVLVAVAAAVICHVIALCTDFWLRSSSSVQSEFLNIGLWRACFDRYIHPHEEPSHVYDGCHDLYSDEYARIRDWLVPSWLMSCRGLAIIALILQIIGIIFLILMLIWILCEAMRCCDDEAGWCDRCLIYITPIVFILAGVFLMSAAMVFADNAFRLQCKDFWVGGGPPNDNRLAYSWGFEVAACILSFISGGLIVWLAVLTARDRKYNYYSGAKG
jgi:hypothetical protein